MSDSHHSPEEIKAAFEKTPGILNQLKEAGCKYPRFELFEDASGYLILGKEGEVTGSQWELASNLVHSVRTRWCMECLEDAPQEHKHEIAIQFCCGLTYA